MEITAVVYDACLSSLYNTNVQMTIWSSLTTTPDLSFITDSCSLATNRFSLRTMTVFYRAMLFCRAPNCNADVCHSVCLSVCNVKYCGHIGWVTWNIGNNNNNNINNKVSK